jgi:hypothetical protein
MTNTKYVKKFWALCENIRPARRKKVKKMMDQLGDRFFTAPASSRYHGAFPGGLLQHSLLVTDLTLDVLAAVRKKKPTAKEFSSYTLVSLFHDIGKIGNEKNNLYLEAENWQKDRGQSYVFNKELGNIPHPLRSARILAQFKINLTEDEFQAIVYHQGLFTPPGEEIKHNFREQCIILHFADLHAAFITEL